MTLNLQIPEVADLRPKITVFGVGGAGCNAVNNMIEKNLDGVDFIVANTDAQALQGSKAPQRIQLGEKITEGLGAGARPQVGSAAAEESIEEIIDHLAGAHMCFITAGMGGGTGTGAAPIIAQAARKLGVLTVGVVTKPFQFEGAKRMRQAEEGVEALQAVVDTLIIIPNQNLFRIANEKTTFTEAFALADDVLYQGVKGVTDLMVRPGLINLDFADIRVVMDEMGKAMMGTGEASGEDRAIQAAEAAIANPLLDEISLEGAKGVLINITGGADLTLFEVDEAANRIRDKVDQDANIIVGSTLDGALDGMMRVSVVATGIDAAVGSGEVPVPRRSMKSPLPLEEGGEAQPAAALPEAPQPMQEVAQAMPEAPAQEQRFIEPTPYNPEQREVAEMPAAPQPAPAAPEPDLFAASAPQAESFVPRAEYSEPEATPEPAYRPQASNAGVVAEATEEMAQADGNLGNPSPETLARLAAAVEKQPRQAPLSINRPAAPQQPDHRDHDMVASNEDERPSGFGLGGLIKRMTGNGASDAPMPQGRDEPHFSRAQPAPQGFEDLEPEEDQIEIPAFLRRQAN